MTTAFTHNSADRALHQRVSEESKVVTVECLACQGEGFTHAKCNDRFGIIESNVQPRGNLVHDYRNLFSESRNREQRARHTISTSAKGCYTGRFCHQVI